MACPDCEVAAGSMADDSVALAATDPLASDPSKRLAFNAGVNFPTAYFYRGYLQQDRGLIVQPFATLGYTLYDANDVRIRPYVGIWNSFHTESTDGLPGAHAAHGKTRIETRTETYIDPGHSGNQAPHEHTRTVQAIVDASADGSGRGWYEAQISAGATFDFGDFTLDAKYHAHVFPSDAHDSVQEIGAKLSYDLVGLWSDESKSSRAFALRPSVLVFREIDDDNGPEDTYIELGIEPAYRFRAWGQRTAVAFPIVAGLSPDGYYSDSEGDDETLGYLSGSIRATIALPVPEKYGTWYLSGTITYLHLFADTAETANRGDSGEVIGMIGIGVSF